ncbi:MAG: class I SAM-dependent methyltransferase [Chloroherpetonaceae bacterium]|nr:class I SAM-dependent methyltransferase [Chthonomonadaceae bacterium]MDW8208026.1 class I SAM-dependent methyltransferase [Chloroherpetonaceae bacterium]
MEIVAMPVEQVQALLRYRVLDLFEDAALEYADYRRLPLEQVRALYDRLRASDFQEPVDPEHTLLLPLVSEARLPHVLARLQVTLALAGDVRGRAYLDIGPGIGRDCIAFARCGARIVHADIPCHELEFAQWRYARRGIRARFVDARALPQERFDLIGCHDCFEHVDDPVQLLVNWVAHLIPGGLLFVSLDLFNHAGNCDHRPANDFYAPVYDALLHHLGMESLLGNHPVYDTTCAHMRVYRRVRPIRDHFAAEYRQLCVEGYTFAERELGVLHARLAEEHERVQTRLTALSCAFADRG